MVIHCISFLLAFSENRLESRNPINTSKLVLWRILIADFVRQSWTNTLKNSLQNNNFDTSTS